MRGVALALVAVASCVPAYAADAPARPPPPAAPAPSGGTPETIEQAADAVLAALAAKDEGRVAILAAIDDPDPWDVADTLLARGEGPAAAAFATASARPDTARLPEYVRRALEHPRPAGKARGEVARARTEREAGRPQASIDLLARVEVSEGDVPAVLVDFERGESLEALGEALAASRAFAAAGEAAVAIGWVSMSGDAFLRAGRAAHGVAAFEDALSHWERGLAIARSRGVDEYVAGLLQNVVIVQGALGRIDRALASHEESLRIRERMNDRAGVAASLEGLAILHAQMGNVAKALGAYERARTTLHDLGDTSGEGRMNSEIGGLLLQRGETARARASIDRALELAGESGDEAGRAWALAALARVHVRQGDAAKALDIQRAVLATFEGASDVMRIISVLGEIGETYAALGQHAEALRTNQRALELSESIHHDNGRGTAFAHLGIVHKALGDYRKALMFLRRAAQTFEETGLRAGLAPTLGEIGDLQRRLGKYAEALATLERTQGMFEEMGDQGGVAASVQGIAVVYYSLGDYERAITLEKEALRRYELLGRRPGVATALANLGASYAWTDRFTEAVEALTRASAIMEEIGDRSGLPKALATLADVKVRSGSPSAALPLLARAKEITETTNDRVTSAGLLLGRAEALRALKRHKEALADFERAAREADRLSAVDIQVLALTGVAQTRLDRGEAALALETSKRALKVAEGLALGQSDSTGARARSRTAVLYEVGALAAATLGSPEEVALFLETGRAGTLLESLGGRDVLGAARLPDDLREAEAAARAAEARAFRAFSEVVDGSDRALILAKQAELRAARKDRLDVAERIQRLRKADAGLLLATVATLEEMQAGLAKDQALVLYGILGAEAVALVATPHEARVLRLGAASEIERACSHLEASDTFTDSGPAAEALRRLVVDPLGLEEETKHVLVSPDGSLSYVPFALLLDSRTVSYVPSGTTYVSLAGEDQRRGRGVLALADPVYPERWTRAASDQLLASAANPHADVLTRNGLGLIRLPGTRIEAQSIGDDLLLGSEATEAGLRAAVVRRKR